MSHKKRYAKVSHMVQDVSDSKDFSEAFEKRLAHRQLIKKLIHMRMCHGFSQEDMAKKLNCSQSRISKLEASEDNDIRMEDLFGYASAMDLLTQLVFLR